MIGYVRRRMSVPLVRSILVVLIAYEASSPDRSSNQLPEVLAVVGWLFSAGAANLDDVVYLVFHFQCARSLPR